MVNIDCTLIQSIYDKVKRLSLQGQTDSIGFKRLLSIIILNDIIKWAEANRDTSIDETRLVKLRDELILCYRDSLQYCTDYNSDVIDWYTSTNTTTPVTKWDRMWDNQGPIIRPNQQPPLEPDQDPTSGLIFGGILDI